jgi:uncharacterized protein
LQGAYLYVYKLLAHPMNASTPIYPSGKHIKQAIFKVASRCNLNCSYCYVYNMADSTWKTRPPLMSDEVFEAALLRIAQQCKVTHQEKFSIAFHGGEPCLIGVETFERWCGRAHEVLDGLVHLHLVIQTNATLLNERWMAALRRHHVAVGLSMDGPRDIHNQYRKDRLERGSYDQVVKGLRLLQQAEIPFGVGCVIPFGADPLHVHRNFLELGCRSINYLMPHYNHDTIGPVREQFGETPCADFLLPIFNHWWSNSTMDVQIETFMNMARVVMGGKSHNEIIGNEPPSYVFIEPDGEMEGLDNLRACSDGLAQIKLNVRSSTFSDLLYTQTMHSQAIFEGMPLANACLACPEGQTCAGGYLPHRYSADHSFNNASVWCADLLKLFAHLRNHLKVTHEQTQTYRQAAADPTPSLESTVLI